MVGAIFLLLLGAQCFFYVVQSAVHYGWARDYAKSSTTSFHPWCAHIYPQGYVASVEKAKQCLDEMTLNHGLCGATAVSCLNLSHANPLSFLTGFEPFT